MENRYEMKDGSLTIHMPKELDHHVAGRLRQETDFMIESYHVRKLVFDFDGTEFMDSSGIGVIIGRSRNIGYFGGEAVAINLSGRMKKIFMVSGLYKLIREE